MKNFKIILLCLVFGILIFKSNAQSPSIHWQKTFGGSESDKAYSVCITKDHGYAVVGGTKSSDGDVSNNHHFPNGSVPDNDVWLVRLDGLGNKLWDKSYGGHGNEVGYSITQTYDNGFIIAGYSFSFDGDVTGGHFLTQDYWLIKTDSQGNLQWQKCLGGFDDDDASKIIQTTDSGYLVTGSAYSSDGDVNGNHGQYDIWVVKLNTAGDTLWTKCFGGSNRDNVSTCAQAIDGGFLIAGQTASDDGDVTGQHNVFTTDVWVIKIDGDGILQWQKCFGGSNIEEPHEIIVSPDGGFYIAGSTLSSNNDIHNNFGGSDFWLFKIDDTGVLEWSKCYGGKYNEELFSAGATSDGGIVMAGSANVNDGMVSGIRGMKDYWVVKVNNVGTLNWAKSLGGTEVDEAYSIIQSPDNGYVMAGYSHSSNIDLNFSHGEDDYWVVKLDPLGLAIPEIENTIMDLQASQLNDQLTLRYFSKKNEKAKMSLYDINGKKVFEKNIFILEGINSEKINCSALGMGMYFLRIESDNGSVGKKVVISSQP